MSKKHKKLFLVLNYIDHSFITISLVSGCVSISAASLIGIFIGIISSVIELKICVIPAGIQKY